MRAVNKPIKSMGVPKTQPLQVRLFVNHTHSNLSVGIRGEAVASWIVWFTCLSSAVTGVRVP